MFTWLTLQKDKKLQIQLEDDKKSAIKLSRSNWEARQKWASFNRAEPNLYQDSFWFRRVDLEP